MSHKLKAVGLAFVAALALSAVAASAASAKENMHYSAPQAPTTGTGTQATQNKFITSAGEITCTTATFSGTQGGTTATTLTVTPAYSGCTAFGFANTHVNTTACDFEFTTPSTRLNATQYTIDPPHVRCPTGGVITITPTVPIFGNSVCTITIGAQTPTSGHLIAENQGTGTTRDVLVTSTTTNIHYTVHGGGGLCGATGTDGQYTGSVTLKGFQDTGGGHANHNGVHEPIEITGGVAP